MKKWKCTVCGYIHEGPEPPETCPVCGAPREKFIEITDEEAAAANPPAAKPPAPAEPGLFARLTAPLVKLHAHPITVHAPNGIMPVVVLFLFLGTAFEFAGLSQAAFYNLVMVVLAMPVVLFTGYVDWQAKYKGAWTRSFKIKITCGIVVLILGVILVGWRLLAPEVSDSVLRWPFLGVHVLMLAAVAVAGEFGGRLVFGNK